MTIGPLDSVLVVTAETNEHICVISMRKADRHDGAVIEHFKAKAGARGYQTLINEALKQAIHAEAIEAVVRRTIREELRRT